MPVIPERTQIDMNLRHISGHMSSDKVALTSASVKAASSACRCRWVCGTQPLPSPPKSTVATLAGTRMQPGDSIKAKMRHSPPAVCSAPRVSFRQSTESMPFCKGTTTVSLPSMPLAFTFSATSGTCHALVHTSTTSTSPTSSRRSVAVKDRMTWSPPTVRSVRPLSRSTRSVSPRATNLTSRDGTVASLPPKKPPTAPAPYTATRIGMRVWAQRCKPLSSAASASSGRPLPEYHPLFASIIARRLTAITRCCPTRWTDVRSKGS
mmetsp:Transcript_20920/g.54626  ORF Transcript_20920/g.54626 Transcript_20920/m.54626 type:complete len:265 (+) Transcript_20920:365-1159(+)